MLSLEECSLTYFKDPRELVETYGNYYHGNPCRSRKVVLSKELLESHELTDVTIVHGSMVDRFMRDAQLASERAQKEGCPLLLLVFCHGLQNYNLLLDNEANTGLGIQALKGVLAPGVPVSLLTTACYSGGWAISELNSTTLAGATASTPGYAWPPSASIGRSIGGTVFASTLIKTLTDSASPLLERIEPSPPAPEGSDNLVGIVGGVQQLQLTDEGPSALPDVMQALQLTPKPAPVMPEQPSEEQMASYNGFCHAIRDTLRQNVSVSTIHQFAFSARQDAWDLSWMAVTGIPGRNQSERPSVSLSYFEQRWNRLVNRPYAGPPSAGDEDPRSQHQWAESSGQPTGPALGASSMSAQMTASLGHARTTSMGQGSGGPGSHGNAVIMAKLFLQTCPGDWNALSNVALRGGLLTFIHDDNVNVMSDAEVFSVIRFRWEYGLLVDALVADLNLPAPSSVMCMLWNRQEWEVDVTIRIPTAMQRYGKVWHALVKAEFSMDPDPELNQGPRFDRPMAYVTAAIVQADLDSDKTMEKVVEAVEAINRAKKFYADIMVKESKSLRERGRHWARSLGLKVRTSLSPRKKSVSDVSQDAKRRRDIKESTTGDNRQ